MIRRLLCRLLGHDWRAAPGDRGDFGAPNAENRPVRECSGCCGRERWTGDGWESIA